MCDHLSLSGCLWVAFHPCVFLPNGYSCIWISVNFQENIRKGVNFDITFKLKALDFIKQTTLQMLSRCADIFGAAYFWACPNGWFSCIKRTPTRIYLWKFQTSKQWFPNSQLVHVTVAESLTVFFLLREMAEVAAPRFSQNICF